jgi:predicted lipid-binding transport protein (Tim44 family)
MRRRRALLLIAAVGLATLVVAPVALASAGGGSAGFSGGEGGGSGGGGGGNGFVIFLLLRVIIEIAFLGHGLGLLVLIAAALVYWFFVRGEPKLQRVWDERRRQGRRRKRETRSRERKVELAAAEAADEDPIFGPSAVRGDAAQLFIDVQLAWDAADRVKLRGLLAPQLMNEWERRLDDFDRKGWRNHSEPIGEPTVEYVGLLRRSDADQLDGAHQQPGESDRVVVRIEAKLRDYVVDGAGRHIKRAGQFTESVHMREYWTLERVSDRWRLFSIESGAEGQHQLQDQIVQNAWSDTAGLRDQAVVEGAAREAVPAGTHLADLADLQFTGDARAAALDLSLADGRFAPDVLEVAARRAVAAWADAVDGPDEPLLAVATAQAAHDLLYPQGADERIRLVVRGLSVRRIRIVALDAAGQPPTMTVDVDLRGNRYLEDRDTTKVVAGSATRIDSFTERWTLALTQDEQQPWRIATAQAPVVTTER